MLGLALTWVVLLGGCWLGWQLLRQNGRMLLRIEVLEKRLDEFEFGEADESSALPIDSVAPEFELPDLVGERKSLAQFRGHALLLIFFNPACGFCRELAPKLAPLMAKSGAHAPSRVGFEAPPNTSRNDAARSTTAVQPLSGETSELPGPVSEGVDRDERGAHAPHSPERPLVLLVSTGDPEKNRQLFNEHNVTCPVLLQKEMEVATTYKAHGTPTGYLINAGGKIASELTVGVDALLALAQQPRSSRPEEAHSERSEVRRSEAESDQSLLASAPTSTHGDALVSRFSNRSLARSKIKRDGLKAGTPAPDFRLPRLDGGELSLAELRGRRVLLVFSDPHCGPCQLLASQLEKFHRENRTKARSPSPRPHPGPRPSPPGEGELLPGVEVVMISRGEPKENRVKVKEHGLTFPVVLQQRWEISRLYAMFATPMAYLIDESGIITHDVAVGVEPILNLMIKVNGQPNEKEVALGWDG